MDNSKDKKFPKSENAGKHMADTPTKSAHAKRTKQGETHTEVDKVTYKDLNMFINAKVTTALKKAKKHLKQQKKEKQVKLNAFGKFCTLNVKSSDNKDKPNTRASIDVDNNDSSTSCLLSNDNSNSNTE
eukprot:11664942-Ditylum_brightwellii.AAC.1